MKAKFSIIIDAIEQADNAFTGYYDLQKNDSVWLSDELYSGETNEELASLIETSTGRFLRLPSPYDIHEYSIMESFVEKLPAGVVQDQLARAIRGKGAFRRFKDGIIRFDMEAAWYRYQAEAYRTLAIRWCINNELEWGE